MLPVVLAIVVGGLALYSYLRVVASLLRGGPVALPSRMPGFAPTVVTGRTARLAGTLLAAVIGVPLLVGTLIGLTQR